MMRGESILIANIRLDVGTQPSYWLAKQKLLTLPRHLHFSASEHPKGCKLSVRTSPGPPLGRQRII